VVTILVVCDAHLAQLVLDDTWLFGEVSGPRSCL